MKSSRRALYLLLFAAVGCATTPVKQEFKSVENPNADTARRVLRQALDRRIAAEDKGDTKTMEEVDTEIRAKFEKKLAVMVTDMSGFTARTKKIGIIGFLSEVRRLFHLAERVVFDHKAQWVKVDADDLFIIHEDPKEMFKFAHELLAVVKKHNAEDPAHPIGLAIGLGYGPTLLIEHDIFGDSVNTASKLGEDIAKADEILITKDVLDVLDPDQAALCTAFEDYASRGSKYPFYICQ